jgi:hypothetical protein
MKKVIKLTESDLMRIVKRVMTESKKFGSFDDEEWYDEEDKFTRVDDMGDDFDDKGRPFKVRTRRGMDEQSFGDYAKDFAMGALGGLGLTALFSPEESWKKLVSTYSPLFGVLNTDTGKNLVKALINGTSAGIIKNMALAASKGDANSFTQAWAQAQKQTKTDLTQLKNAAFKDMKSFGKLLQQSGINEQTIGTTPLKNNNVVCSKFVDYAPEARQNTSRLGITDEKVFQLSSVYLEPHSGGKLEGQNMVGKKVWLNSKGFSDWQAGDTKSAMTAAKELYNGVSGIDVSGQGEKKIYNVAKMWKNFNIFTQNEFLKQWYIISKSNETPWEAIEGDYSKKLADFMINDSTNKVKKYCPTKSISY